MTTGSCLCGAVTYEIAGEITAVHYCHCSRCQKRTGSAFQASAICQRSDFCWVKGKKLIQNTPHNTFCSLCGSSVPKLIDDDLFWIPAGCLGDSDIQFEAHQFVGNKASWFEIADDLVQYQSKNPFPY